MRTNFLLMVLPVLIAILSGPGTAAVDSALITQTDAAIEALRKRNCTVTVTVGGQIIANQLVTISQTKNDFGFGASISVEGFRVDSVAYGNAFCKYFDWATPENAMKWTVTDEMDDYTDFSMGDQLVDWCLANDIKVRGHNLFWNEDIKWLPSWALELTATQFRAAMENRIVSAMTHYKGKVAHWDIINELIHYPQATHGTPEVTMFDSITGDPDIFKWILKRARDIDPDAKFAVNEYAILEDLDATPATFDIHKDKMNRLLTDSSSFEIVGLEGHFGSSIVQANYKANLDNVSNAIPRPIWLTEVDFTVADEERADKTEELLRTSFAHPNVGGVIFWVWWNGNRWRETINSVLVDSQFVETDLGLRWRTLREGWKTNTPGILDAASQFTFRGFHGEYVVTTRLSDRNFTGTFYLEPGEGDKVVAVDLVETTVGIGNSSFSRNTGALYYINGRKITLDTRALSGEQLFIYTYSVAGRLLSKVPVSLTTDNRSMRVVPIPAATGCQIVRIGTADKTLYSGRLMSIR